MERLNKELEATLRFVRRNNRKPGSRALLDEADPITREGFEALCKMGYAEHIQTTDEESGYGAYNRIGLTHLGRTYWSERRRDFIEKNAPVIVGSVLSGVFGIVGALAGVWFGWHLDHL
jgi:hypothetical protein